MQVEDCVLDTEKAGIIPIEKDEIFIQVKNTKNYWISNYGRLINNLHSKYRLHKFSKDSNKNIHYTFNEILEDGTVHLRDSFTDILVAQAFLEPISFKEHIWHIDKNKGNSYYKNLIYVSREEYNSLSNSVIAIDDLGRVQEYVPYLTNKKNKAYRIYNGIYNRCYKEAVKMQYPHYMESTMYEGWKNDTELFCEWYEANYYDVFGEEMAVDKDLLFYGNKEYAPNKCCILPVTLNVMLSNCKKRNTYTRWRTPKNLPLGVRYDSGRKKYYAQISIDSKLGDGVINLKYRDTQEEAFEDYKRHKQAYILMIADKYKNYIPDFIYDALLGYEVQPY